MSATTMTVMAPLPDPLTVYLDAIRAGESRLAELIAQRLFPWTRPRTVARDAPPGARRALERLIRSLGL
jgi:hypothetical protein